MADFQFSQNLRSLQQEKTAIKNKYKSLQSIYKCTLPRGAQKAVTDSSHLLHSEDQLLSSARRYRVPNCTLTQYHLFVSASEKYFKYQILRKCAILHKKHTQSGCAQIVGVLTKHGRMTAGLLWDCVKIVGLCNN